MEGDGPLAAAAIHDGHAVRADLAPRMALRPAERRREEDPCTAEWAALAPTRILGRRSRFEFDLNRARDEALYRTPADCWGLQVWREGLPQACRAESLRLYDAFYAETAALLDRLVAAHGKAVVYDLHSYNHRRRGPRAECDDPAANPEVNLGTGTMDRAYWAAVVERFLASMAATRTLGRPLDVRENVKFRGGFFGRWIHARYPGQVCVLSIEIKKIYMDEWTGAIDAAASAAIGQALAETTPGVLEELARR